MLMIQRKVGQEIHIGDDIVIRVVEGTGRNVKIGIHAPQALKIRRIDHADRATTETKPKREPISRPWFPTAEVAVG